MEKADFLGKGWKFPISAIKDEGTGESEIAISEGEDAIRESISIILSTAKGERVMRPDFGCGINDMVFSIDNISTKSLISFYIKEALQKWEPRIELLSIDISSDKKEGNKLYINIEYKIKTTNTKRNIVYPFYLERGGV